MRRPDPVPVEELVNVDNVDRDTLVACAAQVRAIRDATPVGRPMYRHLTAQLELLDAAVARYDG